MKQRELISCKSFQEVNSEMWETIKSALTLGFVVECTSYSRTFMVSIYKK